MTRLISKWASDESLVSAAINQDKTVKKTEEKPPVSRPVKTKLVSKWADAPDPEPEQQQHAKNTHKKVNTQLPTPPSSAGSNSNHGRHERAGRRKSEGRSDRSEPRPNRGHGQNSDLGGHSNGQRKSSMSDSGHVLANRLGSLDVSGDHKESSSKPKNSHAGRGSKGSRHPEKHSNHQESFSEDESDEEKPTGQMSDAAKSFASRLGAPAKDSGSSRKQNKEPSSPHKTQATRNDKQSAPRSSGGAPVTKQDKAPAVASKYMTPKQKRALEEQEKKAKLAEEQAIKDAKLKAEVQSLFEKMTDKTTSWADFEDED